MKHPVTTACVWLILLVMNLVIPCRAETIARCGEGWLERIDGHLVLHIKGTPYEMGYQHGALLKEHCVENMNYLLKEKARELVKIGQIGLNPRPIVDGIVELQKPFVPRRYFDEMDGLAAGAGIRPEDVRAGNFIPELFHCSGFAVMNSATKDGTLYHGRVLDYKCDWKLQEHAVLVVAEPAGRNPFVNVTYAGFIGSVTGMNAQRISIGEMGGFGLGHWSGVPMALLLREVLETADSLHEAIRVFETNPRTCEYYYVIADGNSNRAVGLAANWEKVVTVAPGEAHRRLPDAVQDAVLLSAGTRYTELVARTRQWHGQIDQQAALRLMDRPVAMASNLHNVLFAPASTRLWVAHASIDGKPAAEQTYQAFQLSELLLRQPDAAARRISSAVQAAASDTAAVRGDKPDSVIRGTVAFVGIDEPAVPERFRLSEHEFAYEQSARRVMAGITTSRVTFPSPVTTVHPRNNTVHCEYFAPAQGVHCPGVVVLHILGGDFELSRMCCRTMASSGIASLFVKMPYYGPRRQPEVPARMISVDPEETALRMTQAVLDIRRAAAWLAARDEVDGDRLGITGISLGGIVSALAAAAEPRFGRACLVLAGGNLARVVIESKELDDIREQWKDRDITPEEVIKMLSPIDPLTYADRLRDRKLLMINAGRDEVIPRDCTLDLWQAAGEPEIVWWNAGHYSAAIYLPAGLARMTRFFKAAPP